MSKTKTQKRRPKTLWSKTKTHKSKTKTHKSKTKTHKSKTKTHWSNMKTRLSIVTHNICIKCLSERAINLLDLLMVPAEWFVTLLIVMQHTRLFRHIFFYLKIILKKVNALAKISARADDKPGFLFKRPYTNF